MSQSCFPFNTCIWEITVMKLKCQRDRVSEVVWLLMVTLLPLPLCVFAEESQGEIEVKDPCACESLVEFQQATMSSLEQITQKHILILMQEARSGTKFKLYIYLVLLENQIVIHSFANRAQPSSDKLSCDVTGMVLLVGELLSTGGYVAVPVPSCFDGRIWVLDYSKGHANTREIPLWRQWEVNVVKSFSF